MAMRIFNTMTDKKEDFAPLDPQKVGVYVCGITAYDSCHLGHARGATTFDLLVRYLRYRGYKVTFVRNFTDVDDKIIKRANDEGKSCTEISEHYIQEYIDDMTAMGNLRPDIEPKATQHIPEMIATINKLIANGKAYVSGGDVFFSVRKFSGYGKLSKKNIEDLEAGARVDVNETKKDPLDFALWKASKPGEPTWDSPWGKGRPGWHIECSAMSSKYLGQPFDIHGGGRDLIFPHHENEIAQAEGAEGKEFVRCWCHNGFVNIDSEKMSKSLGNFLTIREILKRHHPEAVRFFLLSHHYRSPIDYTEDAMANAEQAMDRFYATTERLPKVDKHEAITEGSLSGDEKELFSGISGLNDKIVEAMDDDFNSAKAIGLVFELVRLINKHLDANPSSDSPFVHWLAGAWQKIRNEWGGVFGIFAADPVEYRTRRHELVATKSGVDEAEIHRLIEVRATARKSKDFKTADDARGKLAAMGVEIKDKPDGTTEWRLK